ncbi:MAG TPA: cupin domain-containing protein [Candidatus Saccharimonadales bacterium]|nr:cupin domain-containing protein [Candidatus Saccharimonadales bacterium]
MHIDALHENAAEFFAGTIGEAIQASGGVLSTAERHYYYPGALQEQFLANLPLPIGANRPHNQKIVFPTATDFERFSSGGAALEAYANNPRTTIYEDTAHHGDWQQGAARYLMGLLGYQVAFSFFDSAHGDGGIGPHRDNWHNVAVQFYGKKAWWLGNDVMLQTPEPTLVLSPGDILVFPQNYPHDVRAILGHSVHLSIETRLDTPIKSA